MKTTDDISKTKLDASILTVRLNTYSWIEISFDDTVLLKVDPRMALALWPKEKDLLRFLEPAIKKVLSENGATHVTAMELRNDDTANRA